MATADVCVIYNPAAGRGWATRQLHGLQQALAGRAEFWPTLFPGHAEELATKAAEAGFPLVGAAGGDGTIHEVANGLMWEGLPESSLAVYPIGSANDYAHSLGLCSEWWKNRQEPVGLKPVDVGIVRAPDGRERFFINTLGLGLSGTVNVESRRVKLFRGLPRYCLALGRAFLYHFTHPTLTVTTDGQTVTMPTLSLSVALGQREGNFVMAPRAVIDDGLFDYLHAGPVSRWELVRYFPAMVRGTLPTDHPKLRTGRCQRLSVESETPLTVHVDGEFFCLPEDHVKRIEVEILPARLRVQARLAAAPASPKVPGAEAVTSPASPRPS